jgi:S-adenosylmethionine:tRNA ribosyltransferase-isomerase
MRTADFDYALPPDRIAQTPAPERDHSRLLVLHRDSEKIEHRGFQHLPECLRPRDVLVLNNSRVIPARLRGTNARTGGQFEILLLEENAANDWWAMLRPGKRARVGTIINLVPCRSRPVLSILRSKATAEDGRSLTAEGRSDEAHSSIRNPEVRVAATLSPQVRFSDSTFAHTDAGNIQAAIVETNDEGHRRLCFTGTRNILETLDALGEVPLPPYITPDPVRAELDRERYQTVFAQPAGSVAAPTAGLHFTRELLQEIRACGVRVCFLTLHVGLGTFAPVKTETVAAHPMHEERYELSGETVRAIHEAKAAGGRVIAVGTTTVRVLESVAARNHGRLVAGAGRTRIFIHPPYPFRIVDALLTNFHLPRSTLLMLVSAFAAPTEIRGREMILAAYAEAIRQGYRFFSYGDAMLIL